MELAGSGNRPIELTFKVRPAGRPDLQFEVAQYVAQFCQQHGITEAMIADIRMGEPRNGVDRDGSFSEIFVRFVYH